MAMWREMYVYKYLEGVYFRGIVVHGQGITRKNNGMKLRQHFSLSA